MLRVGRRSGRVAFGPDRQFVATGLDELEAAATGERENGPYDLAASRAHGRFDRRQQIGIQHQQRCAGFGPLRDGWLGVVVGLVAVGLAAASLIMDFDSIKRGVDQGVPAKFAWSAALA